MAAPPLDNWLADPQVRTLHRREATVEGPRLWRAARSVELGETRTLGRLVRWRIPGLPARLTYRELFSDYPFTLLEEGDDYSVSGLCGRIWTLRRDYPCLEGPEGFNTWDEPGTVRVLLAHWVEPLGDERSALISEARVEPTDRRASLRLRALWTVVGRFERLIGAEPLAAATKRARSEQREPSSA
jgi:hypothetical protein